MSETFSTGARKVVSGKPRVDLIPGTAILRQGKWYEKGAKTYEEPGKPGSGEWNWEKGIPFSTCIASIGRHLAKYQLGDDSEDHPAAIAFWANCLMHFEDTKRTELDDRHEFRGILDTVFECSPAPDPDWGVCGLPKCRVKFDMNKAPQKPNPCGSEHSSDIGVLCPKGHWVWPEYARSRYSWEEARK